MTRRFKIPIYQCDFWLVVERDMVAARHRYDDEFGKYDVGNSTGLACWDLGRGKFAIFLKDDTGCDFNTIVHEVFHLAHRISEWASLNFDEHHHEATAQLVGYIFDLVERNTRHIRSATDRTQKRRRRRNRPEIVYGKRARKKTPHTKHRA